jgi:type I restriction enzyme S subunit
MGDEGWREAYLEDLADEITVGHVGSMASEYIDEGIPFLRSQNVEPLRINRADLKFISMAFHERLRKSALKPGDVVIVRTGKPGACAVIPDWLKVANCSDLVIVRCGPNLDARFLSYYVNSVAAHHIGAHLVGAVQQHFNVGSARKILLCLPPTAEQRAIAHILGALDDKAELIRQSNNTLEAMARALFRSWFADFDPVRTKAEGRTTGLPKPLDDLFPDSFEGSELGQIPRGWRLSRLGDETETLLGGTPSRLEAAYWGGDIPWINSGKANEFRIIAPSEFITETGLESSSTKLLPPRTTVIAITGATLGQVSITEIPTCANQSIVGVLENDALPSEFIYFWVKENIDRLIASQTGGAQQHINKNNVNELPVICPSPQVTNAYVAFVRPVFDKIRGSCFESRTLVALRDTLLPQLISGKLRIENAERLIRDFV